MENNSDKAKKVAARVPRPANAPGDFGRIPPQAVDLEQAVLGAMMLEKNAVTDTIDILQIESLNDTKHF